MRFIANVMIGISCLSMMFNMWLDTSTWKHFAGAGILALIGVGLLITNAIEEIDGEVIDE